MRTEVATLERLAAHPIAKLLRCPDCASGLEAFDEGFRCKRCTARFPQRDGILELARFGTEAGRGKRTAETSARYQRQYDGTGRAAAYNQKYARQLFKRWSTRREQRLLRRLLAEQGRCDVILDLPCGGGRLSTEIAPFADLLVEADASFEQVRFARESLADPTPRLWLTASAFHVPFQDASVDGVVCVRLSHHLPSPEERERLLRELLRVARRFAIMTFFDYDSPKNRLRRARERWRPKRAKKAMTVAEVAALARDCGAELRAAPALSLLGSGHRYALLEKRPT